ncbi:hypothetical protein [Nocardia salmonicida]|uniref:hypothetical protein n=1 Tax=Nocardia salmonicida TaxID=53431 RepID=UPI003CF9005A
MSEPQIENRFACEAGDREAELNRRWQARDDRYLAAFETTVEARAAARGITVPIVVTGETDPDRTVDAARQRLGPPVSRGSSTFGMSNCTCCHPPSPGY